MMPHECEELKQYNRNDEHQTTEIDGNQMTVDTCDNESITVGINFCPFCGSRVYRHV